MLLIKTYFKQDMLLFTAVWYSKYQNILAPKSANSTNLPTLVSMHNIQTVSAMLAWCSTPEHYQTEKGKKTHDFCALVLPLHTMHIHSTLHCTGRFVWIILC